VTRCDEEAPHEPVTECSVRGGGSALVLRGTLLTPATVYERGAVRIDADGIIECAGCDCATDDARVVDCGDSVIAPGLVNPHDHLAYDADPPRPLGAERYEHRHDWRLGLRGHTALEYEGGASAVERAAHELRLLLGGATTVAGGAGHAGLVRNPDVSGLGEGLPTVVADSETFPLDDSGGLLLASGCAYGSHHATASDVARTGGFLGHFAEGIDRDAQNEIDCALPEEFGLLGAQTAVVHAVAVDARGAAALGAAQSVVVWSPRSNVALYGNTAPVPLLLRSGVEVALGTDWLLTGSMNLLRELACATRLNETYFDGTLEPRDLFAMVTTAGARAVGAGDALGRLARGYVGDALVVARRAREPHAAVVGASPDDIELVVRGGDAVYGRDALVAALAPGPCEPIDVCGAAQRICTAETGFSLAELQAAADATYPLFTCDVPPDEPECTPSRPGEYDGLPSAGDRDGDGITDERDACPRVFDPVRPLDAGVQADSDGDGVGDACDPCPLDPDPACSNTRFRDRDADGVPDASDVCPDTPDPIQTDTDGDERGDACDACSRSNPGVAPCPLTVAELRAPDSPLQLPRHSRVALGGLAVTALRPDVGSARGFYAQDGDAAFSGVFVYTGSDAPGVVVGDRVAVRGRIDEYYGSDELVLDTLLDRTPGPPLEPLDADAALLGDGSSLAAGYELMLVRVAGAAVAVPNPDAPSDYDETLLDGELRLDDLLYPELDNVYEVGDTFTSVTGIAGRSFDHRKLWPRSELDILR
jgi:hypothetical protein